MTQEMQAIGDIAATLVNRWAWWQNALKGEFGPIHDGHAEQGYYRVRRKGEPWEPVAIFYPESSDEMVAYRAGKEVRPDDIWTWACRNPITFEAYEKAMAGGGFDDEPPAPRGIGDNSGEADPFDAITVELAGEVEQVAEFIKKPVETQAEADRLGIWAKRLTDLAKRADNHRVIEKQPHLPVYFNHKWTHNAWARSWQVNMLIASARAGRIFEAIPIDGDDSERDRAD